MFETDFSIWHDPLPLLMEDCFFPRDDEEFRDFVLRFRKPLTAWSNAFQKQSFYPLIEALKGANPFTLPSNPASWELYLIISAVKKCNTFLMFDAKSGIVYFVGRFTQEIIRMWPTRPHSLSIPRHRKITGHNDKTRLACGTGI